MDKKELLKETARKIDEQEYLNAVELVKAANIAYYDNDEPIMEDPEYDELMQKIKKFEKEHPELVVKDSPTTYVGGTASKSSFEKVKHKVPMLSLQDVFNEDDVKDFLVSNSPDTYYSVEEKIDGLSMSVTYENGVLTRAETRGDGYIGEDITENAKYIKGVPTHLKNETDGLEILEVRCEVYLPVKRFLEINKERENNCEKLFANPRNAAAGILRTKDVKAVKKAGLCAFAFNVQRIDWMLMKTNEKLAKTMNSHSAMLYALKLWGFTPVYNEQVKEQDVLSEIRKIGSNRNNLPYWIDGAVVKIDDLKKREELGNTNKYPRWAVAFKYPPEEKETRIKDIVLQTGRTGRVTPVAILEPVYLAGTKVERATLNNQAFINKLSVDVGSKIIIRKAAEIIPEIIKGYKNREGTVYQIDKHVCPSCFRKITTSEDLKSSVCNNPYCAAQISRKFEFFASRDCMDIRGLGPAQIDLFIKDGLLKTLPDIYRLKDFRDRLLRFQGFGEKAVSNLLKSIEDSKNRDLSCLIKALGIEGVGKHVGKVLCKVYPDIFSIGALKTGQSLEDKKVELSNIEGVGPVSAERICEFYDKNISILFELQQLGVNIKSNTYGIEANNADSQIVGKTFVITGTLSRPRTEIVSKIEENGGAVSGSVSKKTDYLVCGENAGSKYEKAKSLGIRIISEDELFGLM